MSIEVKIRKDYGTFKLDVDFKSDKKRIGILGASGCGKSLTLKSIAGIEKPEEGFVRVNGRTMFDSGVRCCLTPQDRRVGYLFQNYALFPTMTVEKNIGIGLKCGKDKRREKVREIMKRFGLEGLEDRLPGELSGGQQQRVALARIMVYEPDVILLDEPFSALDVYLKDKMQRECMEILKDYPGTVILVSHSRDEIYRFSEETMVIDAGKIIVQKPVKELFANPEWVEAARITGCKNIAGAEQNSAGIWYIPDWGMTVNLSDNKREVCEKAERISDIRGVGIRAVGIRAHEFEIIKPVGTDYITFKVLEPVITEDLFEYNISFLPDEEAESRIDWKISKYQWKPEQGVPEEIYLREERLLYLK